eukprot:scaffold290440_cov18-Tisochrysis_lutea.AAC.2
MAHAHHMNGTQANSIQTAGATQHPGCAGAAPSSLTYKLIHTSQLQQWTWLEPALTNAWGRAIWRLPGCGVGVGAAAAAVWE